LDQQSYKLVCISCGEEYPYSQIIYRCSRCGDLLECRIEPGRVFSLLSLPGRVQSMWRYRELLPGFFREVVTLEEGYTRLVKAERLAKILGVRELYVKMEGLNPTGSFKDRGMSVGVSMAKTLGARQVVCASTGNTSASLAAYASRAGLKCSVYIPEGKIALGKLFQARMFGAEIYQVRGSFDEALKMVLETAGTQAYILNSVNPWRIEGQKTAAYELWEQLGGRAPDRVFVAVGDGNILSGIWKGFRDLAALGWIDRLPVLMGVQAEGAAALAHAWARGDPDARPGPAQTIADSIAVGRPRDARFALQAVRETGGAFLTVRDEEILQAMQTLAREVGVFAEPSAAAAFAGLEKAVREGMVGEEEEVVVMATGNGLKDVPSAIRATGEAPRIPAAIPEALKHLRVEW
jgi:threonine synthase